MSYQNAFDPSGNDHVDYFERGAGIPSRTVIADADVFEDAQFDEDLQLREDPHLWTRLLAEHDAERVPEALATKQCREDSITGDPAAVYEYEMEEIARLCDEFPELRQHRDKREAEAAFRYGRALLQDGKRRQARKQFMNVVHRGHDDERVWACLGCSFLPIGASLAFRALQRLQEVRK